MWQTSLQNKVVLGYYVISALALCLSLFTLVELSVVGQQLAAGERTFALLNNVLEMRRFEKNYFLYRQPEDINQALFYAAKVTATLANIENFQSLPRPLGMVREKIIDYETVMRSQLSSPLNMDQESEREKLIRDLGKVIVTTAEELSVSGHDQVRHALERHRLLLIAALVVVVAVIILLGQALSQRVVLPLRRIEESMEEVANGQLSSIHIPSMDREIISLTSAFNRVLHELEIRQKHLLRSEKLASLGTLLSGVAHELNNPLSNISTSCQILTEEIDDDDLAYKRELLSQMDEQTRRARNIVRSLLDFARDREFRRGPVPLRALMEEVVRFSKGNITKHIQVHIDIPPHLVLLGDRQRLQQAFINLLKNALDAIVAEGEIMVQALLPAADAPATANSFLAGSHCRANSPWVEIHMRDTGTGIPDKYISRIFDPFFTTKPVGQGSGLGLAVVFEVVEEHQGCIEVESQPGQGTLFRLRLPLFVPPEDVSEK